MSDPVRRRLSPLLAQRGAVQQRTQPRRVPWADHPSMRPFDDPADTMSRMYADIDRRNEEHDAELAYQRHQEWLRNQPAATERMAMIRRHYARQPTPDQIDNRAFALRSRRDALRKIETAEHPPLPVNPYPRGEPTGLPENPYEQEDEEL